MKYRVAKSKRLFNFIDTHSQLSEYPIFIENGSNIIEKDLFYLVVKFAQNRDPRSFLGRIEFSIFIINSYAHYV